MSSRDMRLLFVVIFLTGAASLTVEVAMFRVFAPYFGTTIYSTSSVIGVVLGALAVGYALGGRVGDRYPDVRVFWALVATAGCAVSLMTIGAELLLPVLSRFDLRVGVLLASVLFLPLPNVALGMLSPLLIRIVASDPRAAAALGRISGNVFFLSTVGSIAGTLFTGFLLIPAFGTMELLAFVGAALAVVGLVGLWREMGFSLSSRSVAVAFGSIALIGTTFGFVKADIAAPSVREIRETAYGQLRVQDMDINGRPVRVLVMERSISGGIFLDDRQPAFAYGREILDHIAALPEQPKSVLFIGAGPYTVPVALARRLPEAAITVVDIDGELVAIGERWFDMDPRRIRTVTDDGRRFLAQTHETFDVVVLDAFGQFLTPPVHLVTAEFFSLVRKHTNTGGLVIMNVISGLPDGAQLLGSIGRTFSAAFPRARILSVGNGELGRLQNFLIASHGLGRSGWEEPNALANEGLLLTDRYAPIERMMAPIFRLAGRGR